VKSRLKLFLLFYSIDILYPKMRKNPIWIEYALYDIYLIWQLFAAVSEYILIVVYKKLLFENRINI